MKEYKNNIILLSAVLLLYAVYDYYKPEEANWTSTYQVNDKNPFGTFILNERSRDLFDEPFITSYNTISEIDSAKSIVIVADRIEIAGADFAHLFELLENGTHIFLASSRYNDRFIDSLDVKAIANFNMMGSGVLFEEETKLTIGEKSYMFPTALVANHFELDSAGSWRIHGSTKEGPMAISQEIGGGKLILVSNPHIFTNFGLLFNKNHGASSDLLSILPRDQVHYSMFYQFGRPEASTPIRYFLSQPPLKWSIYLALFIVIVFIAIDSWRKQRSIEVVKPPKNSSVEYVKTLGALYFREGNHYKAAMKLINHYFSEIRERFLLEPEFTEKFYSLYSGKSGVKLSEVIGTFELIALIKKTPLLEEKKLVELSNKIDEFK